MSAPSPIVHLYVLLDRSGSMVTMAEQVVAGSTACSPSSKPTATTPA